MTPKLRRVAVFVGTAALAAGGQTAPHRGRYEPVLSADEHQLRH